MIENDEGGGVEGQSINLLEKRYIEKFGFLPPPLHPTLATPFWWSICIFSDIAGFLTNETHEFRVHFCPKNIRTKMG